MTRRGRSRFWALTATALTTLAAAAMLMPATGSAQEYPGPDPASRTFDGGSGGWVGQAQFDGVLSGLLSETDLGICGLLPIACSGLGADIQWNHEAAGGNGGGYLGTTGSGLLSLGSAGSIWQSPAFMYQGDGGQAADLITFHMDTLADGGSLLGLLNTVDPGSLLALESISVKVDLLNNTTGAEVAEVLVPSTSLADLLNLDLGAIEQLDLLGESAWRPVDATLVDPSKLTLGNYYRVRVTTTYDGLLGLGLLGVLPEFNLGFDNVSLNAVAGSSGGPGGPGNPGDPGQPGGPGAPGAPGGPSAPGGSGGSGGDGGAGAGADGGKGGAGAGGAVLNRRNLRKAIRRHFARSVATSRSGRWLRVRESCPRMFNRRCRINTVARLNRVGPNITHSNQRYIRKGLRRSKALLVKPPFRARAKRLKRVFVQSTVKVGKVTVRVNRRLRVINR